jgi:Uma2 family endonuclease
MAEAAFLLDFAREAEQRTAAVEPRIGAVAARLTLRIAGFVEERGLGVVFAPATGFGGQAAGGMWPPDLAFVRGQEGRSTEVVGKLVPQLIAQILPNVGAKNAVEEEARAWLASGTRIVLVLDPFAATVTVYRDGAKPRFLGAEDVLEVPEVLPGWAVPVAELFG